VAQSIVHLEELGLHWSRHAGNLQGGITYAQERFLHCYTSPQVSPWPSLIPPHPNAVKRATVWDSFY